MGVYLRMYRLPANWAVEALSGRQSIGDLKEGNPDSPIYMSSQAINKDPASELSSLDRIDVQMPPDVLDIDRRALYIGRYYNTLADMLTGQFHSYEN